MKVLVVTSCTGEKKFSPENQLTLDDFREAKKLKAREKELEEFALPAAVVFRLAYRHSQSKVKEARR